MNADELRKAYQAFFIKSEAGKEFVASVLKVISTNHGNAENEPDHARDYVQRAKGARQILDHIASVTAEKKEVKKF